MQEKERPEKTTFELVQQAVLILIFFYGVYKFMEFVVILLRRNFCEAIGV